MSATLVQAPRQEPTRTHTHSRAFQHALVPAAGLPQSPRRKQPFTIFHLSFASSPALQLRLPRSPLCPRLSGERMANSVSVSYVLGRFSLFLYTSCTVWLGLSLILCKPICANGCRLTVCIVKCSAEMNAGNFCDEFGLRSEPFGRNSWRPIGTDYLNHAPRSTVTTTDAGINLDFTMAGDLSTESLNSMHKAVPWLPSEFNSLDDLRVESPYSAHRAVLRDEFESWITQRQLQALFVLGMNLTTTWTSWQRSSWSLFQTIERQCLISCNTDLGNGRQSLLLSNESLIVHVEKKKAVKAVDKTGSWKYLVEDLNKLLYISENVGSFCAKMSALLCCCFHRCKDAIFASSLGELESRVMEQILRAYGYPSSLDEQTDCRMLMSVCQYPSHPNAICMSMNSIGVDELAIGYCSNCRIEKCRDLYLRASSHKLMNVPFQEPPIPSKLAFKIFLIALVSIVALCMRAVRQERLPPVVEGRSWQVCNHTIILQFSPSTVCMKACSISNWFEHFFHDGCVGSKDSGITHNRHGSLRWKICFVIMKFTSYIFHVFLLLANFRLEITHAISDVKVTEYNAGAKLPASSKAQPKTQPMEDYRVKVFHKKNRMKMTSQNSSLHKQGTEDGLSPSVMPHLVVRAKVSVVDEMCSSELECPLLKDLQLPDDPDVLSLKGIEKRRRRKRRSNLNTLKHGGEKDCQSCSSSPPSSPASPATPLSSRHLRSDCVEPVSFDAVIRFPNSLKNGDSSSKTPSQPRNRTVFAAGAHLHGMKPKVDNALVETPTVVNPHLPSNGCERVVLDANKGNKNTAVENWASVARRRAIAACEITCPLQCQTSVPEPGKTGGDIPRRPTLLPSATFPQAGCRSSNREKETPDGPSFPHSSLTLSLLARAPGSSRLLKNHECQNLEQKKGSQGAELLYDIWGDHFAEISQMRYWPSNIYCEQSSAQLGNGVAASTQASWWYRRESFFAKPCFMVSDSCSTENSTSTSIDDSSGSSLFPKAQAEE